MQRSGWVLWAGIRGFSSSQNQVLSLLVLCQHWLIDLFYFLSLHVNVAFSHGMVLVFWRGSCVHLPSIAKTLYTVPSTFPRQKISVRTTWVWVELLGFLGGWVCCKFQVKSPVVPVDFGEVVNHIISILLPQTDRKTLLQHQNHTTKRSTPGFSRISTNFVISDVARNSWHFPREIRGGRKWFEITQKQAKEQKLQKSQQFRRTRGNGWIF